MDIVDLKQMHEDAYVNCEVTRERAANDLVFYYITMWDDQVLEDSQLSYRGEFNILRKAGRGITSDLVSNPVQVDFDTVGKRDPQAVELLNGAYKAGTNANESIEAFENGNQENIVCGFGAWMLYADYDDDSDDTDQQVVKRKPIYEANNTVFFDPNDMSLDKANATYVSVLTAYSENGYKDLVEELTGERPDSIDAESFAQPETSFTFPWVSGDTKKIYVTEFFQRVIKTIKMFRISNPFGEELSVDEDKFNDDMDSYIDQGFIVISEREINKAVVTKYIASGKEILNGDDGEVVAGEYLPVVPVYGEYAVIEGNIHYEGITRLAKDPSRLRNFQLSYLADIASRSPREKPIFNPEQVMGHEAMYSETGADNNFPYLLQNRTTAVGEVLPVGPVATLPAPNIPPALVASIELSRQAVEDVANPGTPQDIADPDVSGKAVLALQSRLDMQSAVYQQHNKHAKRRDGQIYASIAAEIFDSPRDINTELADGTRQTKRLMEYKLDPNTGQVGMRNDIRGKKFRVYSKIGPSYNSQKEQTLDTMGRMIQYTPPGDPLQRVLILESIKLADGAALDDVRTYANNQLVLMGIRKPQTPEEAKMLQEEQQKAKEPSPEMVLAQAEMLKGKAAMAKEQREALKAELDAQNDNTQNMIDGFEAETERMGVQIDAEKAGAEIQNKNMDTFTKSLENQVKIMALRTPGDMADNELFAGLMDG